MSHASGVRKSSSAVVYCFGGLAFIVGIIRAFKVAWTCDDAFIGYRYAQNLINGLGLVFNQGVRVEAYTNFLWILWIAVGLRLGFDAETWCIFWGIVFYAGTILLLVKFHLLEKHRTSAFSLTIPVAAIFAALHPDWNIYATSGLESSLFTFFITSASLLLIYSDEKKSRLWSAGLLFALSSLTRPEGILFAVIGGFYLLWQRRPAIRSAAIYAIAFFAIWLPFVLWRLYYYNDLFPNTYYAKSANEAWYSQGWIYVRLYFQRYWILLSGFGILLFLGKKTRGSTPAIIYFVACIGVYCFYLIRIGGDFMFARMMIPITPFLLILMEKCTHQIYLKSSVLGFSTVLLVVPLLIYSPQQFSGAIKFAGIRNEWFFYQYVYLDWHKSREQASVLHHYFHDLPVRLAFYGGQARLMYYVDAPVADECETGLTDYFTARLPLAKRGSVGHEKKVPLGYMIKARKLHFTLLHRIPYHWHREIPDVPIRFGPIEGKILHWDPDLMAVLKTRGAEFPDFLSELDSFLSKMDSMPPAEVKNQYRRFKNFYFDFVSDPERETRIRNRLNYVAFKRRP